MTALTGPVVGRAAEWLARLRSGGMSPAEHAALDQWLADDPAHGRAFAEAERMWRDLDALKAHPEMLRMREQATVDLRQARFRHLAAAAVAACLLIAICAGALVTYQNGLPWRQPAQTFATRIGQRSSIALADGSLVVLDTNSEVQVLPGGDERRLKLVRGRAFFKVAHRPNLPFIVRAGEHSVTALGTQFDVDLRPDAFRVALTEGRVRVRAEKPSGPPEPSVDMNAGYELVASGRSIRLNRIDERTATGWMTGRLVFDSATLGEIAGELNRYSHQPIIVDRSIAGMRMSGVFPSADPEAFLAAAEALGLARRNTTAASNVLLPPANNFPHRR